MPKLQYRFNDTTKDILLYDTPPNDKYIAVQLDGKTYYAGLLPAGHTRASNLRICRAGQEAYAIAKEDGEKAHLEDYSWSEIAAIIKAGNVAEYFSVGDTRPITFDSDIIDSGVVTYRAQILGIDHNAEIEGYNRVHFAIGRDENDTKDICLYGRCMNTKKTHATVGGIASNEGGWEGSDLRSWLNDTFYNALPVDLRTVITPCTKYTDNVGLGSKTEEAVTATSDKIWIPATFEVFGYVSAPSNRYEDGANPYEQNKQVQYDYYKNGNAAVRWWSKTLLDEFDWWLRSPYQFPYYSDDSDSNKIYFCVVRGGSLRACETDRDNVGTAFVPCFTIS